ncbi:ABC transporter permease [Sphingobacterium corticis]|uniref:ABC transporter permease n=1 Tax=Sphingobacterium corticis TaxID=1812823 RepID=A0ABW5NQU2_9SPHI
MEALAKKRLSPILLYASLILGLLILVWVSLFTGVKNIAMRDVFAMSPDQLLVFTIARIPRAIALVLTGAGLSVAGFIMQQLSQNKFVSPTTAGSLEAAKMGILFSMLLIPQASIATKSVAALLFTLAANVLFVMMVRRVRFRSSVFIPLVGIMFGNILAAISTFFAFKYDIVQNVQEWMIGDFSSVLQGQYESIYLILPTVVLAYIYADRFTIVGMGESFAKNLGISYSAIVNLGLFAVSLTVSVSVVTAGAIPFLGLIVPNMVSMMMGDNLRRTLPMTALVGSLFLLFCDVVGRLIIFPYEVPIGLMVGVIGGVVFLILILKRNR